MLSPLDALTLVVYLVTLVGLGLYFVRKAHTTEYYFLAGRRMPWLAVGLSMFASVTSTSPILGLTGLAFDENAAMFMLGVASPLAVPVLVFLFYRFYAQLRVSTSYEYVARRFGSSARYCVALLFCLARLGWLGVVLYSAALALSVLTGFGLWPSILVIAVVTTTYASLGGLPAVIWTDVLQFVVLLVGIVWIAWSLVENVPGGVSGIMRIAGEADHIQAFEWRIDFYEMTGLAVMLSFFFQFLQDYGTDQITVQRLLATGDRRSMAKAAFLNSMADFAIVSLLLFIGLGIFAFSQVADVLPTDVPTDTVFIHYALHALPGGLSGLLIAALLAAAMSSVDSGMNSISSVILNDLVRPLRRARRSDRSDFRMARILTACLGLLSVVAASVAINIGEIVRASLSFLSLFAGPVLALFVLGMLSTRAHFKGWLVGASAGIGTTFWIQTNTATHFIFFFPTAFMVTAAVGYLSSVLVTGPEGDRRLTVWDRGGDRPEREAPVRA